MLDRKDRLTTCTQRMNLWGPYSLVCDPRENATRDFAATNLGALESKILLPLLKAERLFAAWRGR